jgi:hypothetical protein
MTDSSGHQHLVVVVAQPGPATSNGISGKIGVVAPILSGYVRVAAYNAVGESPMSDAETAL